MKKKSLALKKKLWLQKDNITPLNAQNVVGGATALCPGTKETCNIVVCEASARGTCAGNTCNGNTCLNGTC